MPIGVYPRPQRYCTVAGCKRIHRGLGLCDAHYQQQKRGAALSEPAKRNVPLAERFWAKVDKSGNCWTWTAFKNPKGYGLMGHVQADGNQMAHRVSWVMANGEIPAGMLVLHRCDNPSCVRPDHLFLGTAQDNADDMMRKGRGYFPGPLYRKIYFDDPHPFPGGRD